MPPSCFDANCFSPVDIAGWFLSDDLAAPHKYKLQALASASPACGDPSPVFNCTAGTVGTFTGGDAGEGLDFSGYFPIAFYVLGTQTVQVGDASFIPDMPGTSVSGPNRIVNWVAPNLGTSSLDKGLAQVTRNIKWVPASTNTITVTGLVPGIEYSLQLMYFEACCQRIFDITVNGCLIAPAFRPGAAGVTGSPSQGSFARFNFLADSATMVIALNGMAYAGGTNDVNPTFYALSLEQLTCVSGGLTPFIIPPGGYVTINSTELGFSLPSSASSLYLFPAVNGYVKGYSGLTLGRALTDHPFGRWVLSTGRVVYPFMKTPTPLGPNSGPLVGPVVIEEFAFSLPAAYQSYEYVKLTNTDTASVSLTGTYSYSLSGSISFKFAGTIQLLPGASLYVTPVTDTVKFLQLWNFSSSAAVYNTPYNGTLFNRGGTISMFAPLFGGVPVEEEQFDYGTFAVWDDALVQSGNALLFKRNALDQYSGDPLYWTQRTVQFPATLICTIGSFQACSMSHASQARQQCLFDGWGLCNIDTCDASYHLSNNACVLNQCVPNAVKSCTVQNGVGIQSCGADYSWSLECFPLSCDSGFYQSGKLCVAQPTTSCANQTQVCLVSGGSGLVNCTNTTFGACVLQYCNQGYGFSGGICKAAECVPLTTKNCTTSGKRGLITCTSSSVWSLCQLPATTSATLATTATQSGSSSGTAPVTDSSATGSFPPTPSTTPSSTKTDVDSGFAISISLLSLMF
jgi:hypothetical protein